MQVAEVMQELAALGSEQGRKIHANHGAVGDFYGVKVGDLKKILKKTKNNHQLALELYETGNMDAMYLAGLMADAKAVTPEQLDRWVHAPAWYMVLEYAVAGLAAESKHGWTVGLKWIEAKEDQVSASGWFTLAGVISIRPDKELDVAAIAGLIQRVRDTIHEAPNRTRYCMNGFVIAAGSYVPSLTEQAMATAREIGKVTVFMGRTSCKVPFAPDYIEKIASMGRIGHKRKHVRC